MQVLCLYRPRKSKPRVKIELRKQQYTVTLFDYNFHLAQFFGRFKNLCVTAQFLFCFILNVRAVSKHKPPGVFRKVFCFTSSGGLFSEFYGITVSHISSSQSASRKSRLNNSRSGKKFKYFYKQN